MIPNLKFKPERVRKLSRLGQLSKANRLYRRYVLATARRVA